MCVLENGAGSGSGICLEPVTVIVVCPRRKEPLEICLPAFRTWTKVRNIKPPCVDGQIRPCMNLMLSATSSTGSGDSYGQIRTRSRSRILYRPIPFPVTARLQERISWAAAFSTATNV